MVTVTGWGVVPIHILIDFCFNHCNILHCILVKKSWHQWLAILFPFFSPPLYFPLKEKKNMRSFHTPTLLETKIISPWKVCHLENKFHPPTTQLLVSGAGRYSGGRYSGVIWHQPELHALFFSGSSDKNYPTLLAFNLDSPKKIVVPLNDPCNNLTPLDPKTMNNEGFKF